jgi:hypothetical protein
MANFLFLYRGNTEGRSSMTPEQIQENMQQWGNWIRQALKQGWMVDPGDALTPEGRVVNPKKVITDGPFVEAKECIGGYSIIKADNINAAAELAKGCPGLLTGGRVEVRPLAGLAAQL